MRYKTHVVIGCSLFVAFITSACSSDKFKTPKKIYMPDMVYSPAVKAQTVQNRLPPVGTIPTHYKPYPYADDSDAAEKNLKNPVVASPEVIARGKHLFATYCAICHGKEGRGDGTIVEKFIQPPSLLSAKVREWQDGGIYHMIRAGRGLMSSYAHQISSEEDRWAVVHYVRALQKEIKEVTP